MVDITVSYHTNTDASINQETAIVASTPQLSDLAPSTPSRSSHFRHFFFVLLFELLIEFLCDR